MAITAFIFNPEALLYSVTAAVLLSMRRPSAQARLTHLAGYRGISPQCPDKLPFPAESQHIYRTELISSGNRRRILRPRIGIRLL